MGHFKKPGYARLMISAAVGALTLGASAAWAETKPISIPAQSLSAALHDFGSQTGRPIMFSPSATALKTTTGVSGVSDQQLALSQLLQGTGLTFRREGDAFVILQQGEGGSPQGESAAGGGAEVEALIVTAQKKEEQIQDVPIAISAFSQKSLDAQKIEGGFDLLKAIPNVTFSKSNFSGYNFSIRGIGTKAISATTDPGVAVSFNNTTLIVNRLFEQEYFDIERVEVLRGPQGTLYGRNATGGVINVITARPQLGEYEAEVKLETGNYDALRGRGMINVPVGDTLAIRAAGAFTKRSGYGLNTFDNSDVDDRDLWSARLTVGWEPVESIRVNALWERFEEDDQRVRTSKQLCYNDPGRQTIGAFDWDDYPPQELVRSLTSQGCLPGSMYEEGAFGTPNGMSLPYIIGLYWGPALAGLASGLLNLGPNPYLPSPLDPSYVPPPAPCAEILKYSTLLPVNVCNADPYRGLTQSHDLRTIESRLPPSYRAKADIFELSLDLDLTENVTFTSQTVYSTDEYYATQDYNRFTTLPIFQDSSVACGTISFFGFEFPDCSPEALGTYADGFYNIMPGGVFTDPQLGPSDTLVVQDLSEVESEQFNQEFRLATSFDGPWNFSIGTNFTRFETLNDYYVFSNAFTLVTKFYPFDTHRPNGDPFNCGHPRPCIYVDPNPLESIDGEGHNYFRSSNPYELTSSAIFGELYWQATETLKVTLGARMSWDQKIFTPIPSQLLLYDYRRKTNEGEGPEFCTSRLGCMFGGTAQEVPGLGAKGSPPLPDIVQEWREPTGRIIVDWKPDLAFTDETMIYGSLAHGYKGGGANPPGIAPPSGTFNALGSGAAAPATFEPEFIDALEIGTKNTLLDGALILNGSAFYYDYKGYQVSKIVDRSAANENFDATVKGLELEWIWSPMRNLRFNGTVGHLQTEIADGERSIDLMDRAQGGHHSSYIDADGVEHQLEFDEWMVLKPWVAQSSNCVAPVALVEASLIASGGTSALFPFCPAGGIEGSVAPIPGGAPNGGAGFFAELGGNELPNSPRWTASFGGQYSMDLPVGWRGTFRVDHYWQDDSFARVYNTEYDELRAWQNTNFSLWFEQRDWGVKAEVYVKNAFDEMPITDAFLNSDDSGLTTNVFTLDPRLVGVSVTKTF